MFRWHSLTTDKEPNTPNEIGYNNCNNNDSYNLVNVKNYMLCDNLFISRFITTKGFDQLFESRNINKLNQPWQTKKS